MKRTVTALIIGMLVGAALFGSIAIAADLVVNPSTHGVYVDGKKVTISAYNINGANYFQARDFAIAMDIGMWFNAEERSIMIETDKRYDPDYTGVPTAATYGRTNPAPVGVTQTIKVDNYSEAYTLALTVNSAERGAAAWEKIKAANMFNSEAEDGQEYVIVEITAKALATEDDKAVSLYPFMFDLFSSNNVQYDGTAPVVEPEPRFSGDVYENATLTGYVVFVVNKTDSAPKMVYGRNYDGTGGVWFSLT